MNALLPNSFNRLSKPPSREVILLYPPLSPPSEAYQAASPPLSWDSVVADAKFALKYPPKAAGKDVFRIAEETAAQFRGEANRLMNWDEFLELGGESREVNFRAYIARLIEEGS